MRQGLASSDQVTRSKLALRREYVTTNNRFEGSLYFRIPGTIPGGYAEYPDQLRGGFQSQPSKKPADFLYNGMIMIMTMIVS